MTGEAASRGTAVPQPSDRLIVALDVPSRAEAEGLVEKLGDTVAFYKIGHELLFADGLGLARELKRAGKRVFLDMKLLDIGNTMQRSVAGAAEMGVDFLTIHGHDTKTIAAAAAGRAGTGLKLLAVTVLTNLDGADLAQQGIIMTPEELALRRAKMAHEAGADGVIASGREAAMIRAATAPGFLIVTPGIRPHGSLIGDQSRVVTPAQAIFAGADHIVVGRPITSAEDQKSSASTILHEIAVALQTPPHRGGRP